MCDVCGREIEYSARDKRRMVTVRGCGLVTQQDREGDVCDVCHPILTDYLNRVCRVVGEESRKQVPYEPWNTDWSDCPTTPTAKISTMPSSIEYGESAILIWETKNATEVLINGATVDPSGEISVTPDKTAVYSLVAKGENATITTETTLEVVEPLDVVIETPLTEGRYMLSDTVGQIFTSIGGAPETEKPFNTEVADSVSIRVIGNDIHFAVNVGAKADLYVINTEHLNFDTISELLSRLRLDEESKCDVTGIRISTVDTELMFMVNFMYDQDTKVQDRYMFDTVQP